MTEPERPTDAPPRSRRFPTTRWSVVRVADTVDDPADIVHVLLACSSGRRAETALMKSVLSAVLLMADKTEMLPIVMVVHAPAPALAPLPRRDRRPRQAHDRTP
jgi:hypothetical protein